MGFTWGSRYTPENQNGGRWGQFTTDHAFFKVCDVFDFEPLNKHQEKAIRQVVESKTDVCVNLPTGYGSLLCSKLLIPTVFASVDKCEKNIVIVISALISPMKDQESRLSLIGVSAVSLSDISSA